MSVTEPSVMRRKAKALPMRRPRARFGRGRLAEGRGRRLRLGLGSGRLRPAKSRLGSRLDRLARLVAFGRQSPLALDEPPRHVIGDGGDDPVDLLALGDQHPTVQRVLGKAVGSPVAPHLDKGDHVEKETRPLARGERQIEQVDARGRLPHQGFELALEQREASHLDLAQLRDRIGALGVLTRARLTAATRSGFGA